MNLFDRSYFLIAYVYDKIFQLEEISEFAAGAFISLFQLLNVITVISYVYKPIKFFDPISALILFLVIMPLLIIHNFLRYRRNITYDNLKDKWQKQSEKIKYINLLVVICYGLLSIVFGVVSNNFF